MERDLLPFKENEYGFIFHYYRAEVYRETNWRSRLDVTSNWVIVVTGAMLSFAFGDPQVSHGLIILNYLVVIFFLYIEARRFRYYTMLRSRTRLMEQHLFAPMFSGEKAQSAQEWGKKLAQNLANPKVAMTRIESLGWRIRRQYIFLFPIVFIAWISRIYSHPFAAQSFFEAVDQAQLWFIPGIVVFALFLGSLIGFALLAYVTVPRSTLVDDLP